MELATVNVRNAWLTILGVSTAAIALLVWVIYIKEQPANTEDVLPFLPFLTACSMDSAGAAWLVVFSPFAKAIAKRTCDGWSVRSSARQCFW